MPLSDLLHLLAPLVTSCRGFQKAWNSAPAVPPGDPLTGRWHGDWHSDASGFHGPLRGEVAGDLFTSTFRSRTDHGTFRMRRV
jgi:hypothetical protein